MFWKAFAFFYLFLLTRMPWNPTEFHSPYEMFTAVLTVLVAAGLLAYATKLVPLQSRHKKAILFWKTVAVVNVAITLFAIVQMSREQLPAAYSSTSDVKLGVYLVAIVLDMVLGFFSSLGVWLYASSAQPSVSGQPNSTEGTAMIE